MVELPARAPRLLIAEDDELLRSLLIDVFVDEGYDVRGAANGREALDMLQSDGWLPDAIVLDLMMPVMDGRAFRAAQLRLDNARHVPVVIVSAAHDGAAIYAELGAQAFVPKPYDLNVLITTVQGLLPNGE